jgi:hypothetical protein
MFVWFYGTSDLTGGNELSVKVRDTTSNRDMAERTGIDTNGLFKIEPTKYEPDDTKNPIEMRTRIRSSNGDTVRVFTGSPVIGIQI